MDFQLYSLSTIHLASFFLFYLKNSRKNLRQYMKIYEDASLLYISKNIDHLQSHIILLSPTTDQAFSTYANYRKNQHFLTP